MRVLMREHHVVAHAERHKFRSKHLELFGGQTILAVVPGIVLSPLFCN